mmetsp:Transcript_35675/g.60106  ORF Transcript_35675/g.60106 Transcript_35675/m.60106 type:complete len:306 (-) Transcript_35675:787-1704(-)
MFALMPFGGSFVSLTPFCSTSTGKVVAGMDVRNRRKSSWLSVVPLDKPSTIISSLSIHDLAKWQFWRHTQSPVLVPLLMRLSAMGPWPCPRLIMCSRSPGIHPFFSAKRCNMEVGSAPVVRMKMMGVPGAVSLNTLNRFHGLGSVNCRPSLAPTNVAADSIILSSRITLTINMCWNSLSPLVLISGRASSPPDSTPSTTSSPRAAASSAFNALAALAASSTSCASANSSANSAASRASASALASSLRGAAGVVGRRRDLSSSATSTSGIGWASGSSSSIHAIHSSVRPARLSMICRKAGTSLARN